MTFPPAWKRFLFLSLIGCFALTMPNPAHAQSTEVVFLAGPKDHGWPGRHEYEKDLRVLAQALEAAPNLSDITTSVYVGEAPRDLSVYENAAVIVINSSSDRLESETHPLFPPDPTTNHRGYDDATTTFLEGLDSLIVAKEIGVVVLHYANWAENWAARGYYMTWLGGLWVQMGSRNPTDQWTMTPLAQTHPVLRGVQEWTYRDEVFSRFFLPPDHRRTDLLRGSPEQDRWGIGPQIASWAYQRDDGGRGFVYGGVDFHDNMLLDDYRRFLLNGIVWAAGLNVPVGGVESEKPVIEDSDSN